MIGRVGRPTVLLAGGGTGGHLFPGVAVAESLQRLSPGARCVLASTARDAGTAHLAASGLDVVTVDSPRLPRRALDAPRFGLDLAAALVRSRRALRAVRPDVVVGLGGYGSVAPVVVAWLSRIPVLLLEQNALPGRATRVLSRLAALTAASYPGLPQAGVHGRVEVTGNPVRASVLDSRPAHEELGLRRGLPVLGVLGGSLGAQGLTRRFEATLPLLATALSGWRPPVLDPGIRSIGTAFQVIHATGSEEVATEMRDLYERHGVTACVRPFFTDMAAVYGTADVLLSRAGGTTVAEITALGRAAVFVPYPHHADDHQHANARTLFERGGAALVSESDCTPDTLLAELLPLLAHRDARQRRASCAARLGRPDAADAVARHVLALSGLALSSLPADASQLAPSQAGVSVARGTLAAGRSWDEESVTT